MPGFLGGVFRFKVGSRFSRSPNYNVYISYTLKVKNLEAVAPSSTNIAEDQ